MKQKKKTIDGESVEISPLRKCTGGIVCAPVEQSHRLLQNKKNACFYVLRIRSRIGARRPRRSVPNTYLLIKLVLESSRTTFLSMQLISCRLELLPEHMCSCFFHSLCPCASPCLAVRMCPVYVLYIHERTHTHIYVYVRACLSVPTSYICNNCELLESCLC